MYFVGKTIRRKQTIRFKQYLTEEQVIENVIYLLERLEIKQHDKTIKKISNNLYTFSVNTIDYEFHAEKIPVDNYILYNVYFNTSLKDIDRQNKLSLTDTYKVFNKIITCMIYFINDQKPSLFTFSTNDPKLQKMYMIIVTKVMKTKPFSDYYYKNHGSSITFKRKQVNETFLMNDIIKKLYKDMKNEI
jgi:hypothetical protein